MNSDAFRFPTTHWSVLEAARGPMTAEQRAAVNCLIGRYWKPVYAYICRRGHKEEAADLTQEFFVHILRRELFARPDRARGRFRSFLLTCLRHYLVDVRRRQQRRSLVDGIMSIQQLAKDDGKAFEPAETETPEDVFLRAWVGELLDRVWGQLEKRLHASGHRVHCELFRLRVFEPAIVGASQPPLSQLAEQFGLSKKQASNRIMTAIRAFRRLLEDEIRIYASTDDEVKSELRDLFRFATKHP